MPDLRKFPATLAMGLIFLMAFCSAFMGTVAASQLPVLNSTAAAAAPTQPHTLHQGPLVPR